MGVFLENGFHRGALFVGGVDDWKGNWDAEG